MQNLHSLLGLVWSSFHCFLLFYALFIVVHCFLMGLCIDGSCWSGGPLGLVGLLVWWALGLVGPWVWWACGSGGFCGVLTDKSPFLRGPTCQGVLGLVFHRFPGTSIRPHYMPSVSRFGIFESVPKVQVLHNLHILRWKTMLLHLKMVNFFTNAYISLTNSINKIPFTFFYLYVFLESIQFLLVFIFQISIQIFKN